MCKGPIMGCSPREIFALHKRVIGCWVSEGKPVPLVVCPHARKIRAAGYLTFEMVDVRWFLIEACRLIVAAVLVEPGYGKGVRAIVIDKRIRFGRIGFGVSQSRESRGRRKRHP